MIEPAPRRAHAGRHQPDEPEGALQIDLDHLVELAVVDLETRALRHVRARVVHQNVDAPVVARDRVDHPRQLLGLAHVTGQWDYAAADLRATASSDSCLRPQITTVAPSRESCRDCFANPAAPACDDRDFLLQLHRLIRVDWRFFAARKQVFRQRHDVSRVSLLDLGH